MLVDLSTFSGGRTDEEVVASGGRTDEEVATPLHLILDLRNVPPFQPFQYAENNK